MHLAARSLDSEICSVLIAHNAKVVKNKSGDTPLLTAISQATNTPQLGLQPSAFDHLDSFRIPLLATRRHKSEICRLFKQSIHEKDAAGNSALHRALFHEKFANPEVHVWVGNLLDSGADVSSTNNLGQTPIHLASIVKSPHIEKMSALCNEPLESDRFGNSPVHYACASGALLDYFERFNEEIDIVADQNDSGWSPLHIACFFGNENAVQYLINRKVNLNATIRDPKTRKDTGKTALMIACEKGHKKICELLVSRPDLDTKMECAHVGSALDWACESGDTDIIEILFENGIQGESYTKNARLLQRACLTDNSAMIEKIWDHVSAAPFTEENRKELLSAANLGGYMLAIKFIASKDRPC